MAKKALPKRIYVKREFDAHDKTASWLQVEGTTASMEHGETIGIYELVETKTVRVTKDLD